MLFECDPTIKDSITQFKLCLTGNTSYLSFLCLMIIFSDRFYTTANEMIPAFYDKVDDKKINDTTDQKIIPFHYVCAQVV